MLKTVLLFAPLLLAAAATPIQPGKWTTTVTVVDMQMPGAPPQVAAMLRGRPTTVTACVSPADAAAGPRAAIDRSGGRCRYTSFAMTGGRIESTMTCNGNMTMRGTGSYTPTSITMDATSVTTGASAMTMRTHTESRLTGGC